ncbi:MAG: nucleotidyltransferase domain-containing protein [Nanoarchaeota archaeon]
MIIFLKIINFLGKHPEDEFSMHELSHLLHIPYATFYRYVKRMIEQEVLKVRTVGRSKVIKLNLSHPILKAHLTSSSFEEMQEFIRSQPLIRKIVRELKTGGIILLFGSYAKRKQTEKSDIDILIINKDGKKSVSFSKYELLFKKEINPIFVTKKEFKRMLKDKEENVAKQALKDHIILHDPEGFWQCVLNGI